MRSIAWVTYAIISGAIFGFSAGAVVIVAATAIAAVGMILFTGDMGFPTWFDRNYSTMFLIGSYSSAVAGVLINVRFIYNRHIRTRTVHIG